MSTRIKIEKRKKEEGWVLVTVAVALVALVGFVALAVDVGLMYAARTSAQEVADAAALAGALTFITNPLAVQPDTAQNHALQVAINNQIMGEPVTAPDVSVNVDVAARLVTVDVTTTQNTHFAKVLGPQTADIEAQGTAEAAEYATGSSCTKPWFIPNTVFATAGACAACGAGEVLVSGGEVTDFATMRIGQQFTVRSSNPAGAMAPGQFYAIQLPGSVGGNDYRENIATCNNEYVRCGNVYSVETGNMVGPTNQGVRNLIGDPSIDTWTGVVGEYQTPTGLSDMSRNLIVAPIWDACGMPGFCPGESFPSGTQVNLQVIGFAVLFLEGISGNDVLARFINVSACGAGGAGGGGAGTETGGTVLSLPLRLVRVP